MIVLIIIGVLILISVLLLNVPVTAHIKFYGGQLELALKYLGIGIVKFPRGKKKRRRKKRKRSRLQSTKMSPSEKPPLEEDEEIFEDIADIGFTNGTNDGSEFESSFDEDDLEEGDVENRENEQENISDEKFAGGGYQTEDSTGKNAEISMNNSEDDSGNSEEKSEDNSGKFKENPVENLKNDSEEFKKNPAENSEGDSGKTEKNLTKKSNKKSTDGKKSARKKSSGKSDGESNDDEPKKPLGERLSELLENIERKKNAALLLWELCEGHLIKLLGKVTVDGLAVDFAAADEDAARAALAYGRLCAGFYNLLGVIMSITRVKIRSVSIDCLYNTPSEKARYDGEFKVRLRPASVLNAFAAILFDYVRGRKKYKSALDEFIGSSAAAVSMSANAVKRYRAKNSTN
ncbi:MAG: hypothetical protein K2N72_09940 [Oscillospiraceae bacterium]|nr:hypothetical protein [Oscillospiraceae bacterium]